MTIPEQCDLYIHKENHPNIIVKILSPKEKIHGWSFQNIELKQRLNDNPLIFHWKTTTIPFKGELISSILDTLNHCLKE